MLTYSICMAAVVVIAVLLQPVMVTAEVPEEPLVPEDSLCSFVRSAANRTQLDAEASARLREEGIPAETTVDQSFPFRGEEPSFDNESSARFDRELFESSLVNWFYFEDLAREQRAIIRGMLSRCGNTRDGSSAVFVFGQFHPSQRTTFVGITHAMLNTRLVDRVDRKEMGDALQLVEGLLNLRGENVQLPSDQQFQMIVRLAPHALEKLDRAADFEKGENHVFHKGYPISFRQFRRMGRHGQEAGLHISLTRDGRRAEIHVDYRFGLLHLGPANADVRAQGNHQKHVDRWPVFGFALRRVQVRRVVLRRPN